MKVRTGRSSSTALNIQYSTWRVMLIRSSYKYLTPTSSSYKFYISQKSLFPFSRSTIIHIDMRTSPQLLLTVSYPPPRAAMATAQPSPLIPFSLSADLIAKDAVADRRPVVVVIR
jgi:hypothetical protein